MWRLGSSRALASRVVLAAVLACVVFVPAGDASADSDLDRLEAMWARGDYAQVMPELINYRERTRVRTPQLDYMIATSACRMPDRRHTANEFFAWILQNYNLSPAMRTQVATQRRMCSAGAPPEPLPVRVPPTTIGIVYHGKGGTDYTSQQPAGNRASTLTVAIPTEDFVRRLFVPSDSKRAVLAIATELGPEFVVHAVGHFVLAGPRAGARPSDLKKVGESLEDYLRFFVSEYGMGPPSFLITVYFAGDRTQLGNLAQKLHGITLAPGSIGYSFAPDQSIVGWADGKAYGTLAHELFHVMVRNNSGDTPPFLEEGMAALYEVSGFEGNRVFGVPNWRGAILRNSWGKRPQIKDLVQMDWSAFDDIAGPSDQLAPGEKQSANHATARYLMLYLQQRGELLPVYKAFLNRKVNDHPAAQSVLLLETVLGRSLDTVDAEFAAWFKAFPP